jgi:GNAT superfamily N-acetyltransferase
VPPHALVRPLELQDLPALKAVIDQTGLFPSALLDGMLDGYFEERPSANRWLTYDVFGPVALLYAAPERLTEGTWNLLLLAVQPDVQGTGIGTALVNHLEHQLAVDGVRMILVETSGLPDFERTRSFYRRCGYTPEATIRDFYRTGEDKIIFRKVL